MKSVISFCSIFIIIIIVASCEKNEKFSAPEISFKIGEQYTQDQDVIMVGYPIKIGISAISSDAVLTNFTVEKLLNNGSRIVVMDTGIYTESLDIEKTFYQNFEDTAEWIFSVMDRNRLSSRISLNLYKDPDSQFGGIVHHAGVKMGYQLNTEFGHFYDIVNNKVYFEDSASLFEDQIDILTYFIESEDEPSPVFSSPGEMDNFGTDAVELYPSIENWLQRNYTLWDISVDVDPISTEAFDNAHNDSLLIAAFHDVWGKKKFKWATTGRVIPFMTQAGKKGLIKVTNAELTVNGKIEFDIKIQH